MHSFICTTSKSRSHDVTMPSPLKSPVTFIVLLPPVRNPIMVSNIVRSEELTQLSLSRS